MAWGTTPAEVRAEEQAAQANRQNVTEERVREIVREELTATFALLTSKMLTKDA